MAHGSGSPACFVELSKGGLVNSDAGKTITLHPYSEGAQSRPQSEFNLDHVTPETLEHFSKFMKNPKRFIQEMQQREQKQQMRRLAEEAQKNPDVLESLRELFKEEMPGKESREINLRKFGKGTERLTPDQINPEAWESVSILLTERRELNDNTDTTVVLVHGFVGNGGDPVNCGGGGKCPTKWEDMARQRGTLPSILDTGTNFPGQNRFPSSFFH